MFIVTQSILLFKLKKKNGISGNRNVLCRLNKEVSFILERIFVNAVNRDPNFNLFEIRFSPWFNDHSKQVYGYWRSPHLIESSVFESNAEFIDFDNVSIENSNFSHFQNYYGLRWKLCQSSSFWEFNQMWWFFF